MTVKKMAVTLGEVQGNEVLITSGVKAGDQVITAGVHVLTDGQKVAVYQPKDPAAASVTKK
jgi:multidrug efflux pump subunit AcrA (membrane-fusion protein)